MVAAGSVVLCDSVLSCADACGVAFRVAMDAQFASHSDWLPCPAKRRQAVEHVRDTLGRDEVTERRACRVLGQARNSHRRTASVADDEQLLVKRIVWMASEYGRYG
jgi:hypothetical protein